jgi:DNA primase
VSRVKQFYYCFGCGAHGNVINFLMQFDRLDFVSTIELLAQHAGIPIPYEQSGKAISSPRLPDIYTGMEKIVRFYEQQLKADQTVIQYLKSRGVQGKTAKHFCLGAAPNDWHALQHRFKDQAHLLKETGMLIEKNTHTYDRFRNRLMFPIRNARGQFIGFGARTLTDEQPKYINSPETSIFHKSQELYGLYEALQSQNSPLSRALIVEGYMDVISLFQAGITDAVATLGTAINAKHLHKLLRYTHHLVFCFDGDIAGKTAARKALSIALTAFTREIKISFMFLPKGEDPDTLINRIGREAFEKCIDQAMPLSTFFFQQIQEKIPLKTMDDRALFAQESIKRFKPMPNGPFKDLLEKELIRILNVSQDQLDQWLCEKNVHSTSKTASTLPHKMHPGFLAIAILLNQPSFIQFVENPMDFELLTFKYSALLTCILTTFKQNPQASTGYLLTVIDQAHHNLIAKLAQFELPSTRANAEAEFLGALARLRSMKRREQRQQLIKTAQEKGTLTEVEKEKLQRLFNDEQEN